MMRMNVRSHSNLASVTLIALLLTAGALVVAAVHEVLEIFVCERESGNLVSDW